MALTVSERVAAWDLFSAELETAPDWCRLVPATPLGLLFLCAPEKVHREWVRNHAPALPVKAPKNRAPLWVYRRLGSPDYAAFFCHTYTLVYLLGLPQDTFTDSTHSQMKTILSAYLPPQPSHDALTAMAEYAVYLTESVIPDLIAAQLLPSVLSDHAIAARVVAANTEKARILGWTS